MVQREKRSVSLPAGLTRRIAEEAARQGTTFSGWLSQTAERRLKLEAGRRALDEWERENGALTSEELADAGARVRRLLGPARAQRKRRSA